MKKEVIECIKCEKIITPNKDEIMECYVCHKKFCYQCSLDYTHWKTDDTIYCKECGLEMKSDWGKLPHRNNTEQSL